MGVKYSILISIKEGGRKKIHNIEVIEDIKNEIRRLESI